MLDWEKRLAELVSAATSAAVSRVQELTKQGIDVDCRLFYRPATESQDGQLFVLPPGQQPSGALLGSEDRFHGGIPYENYSVWLRQRIGRLPLLASR